MRNPFGTRLAPWLIAVVSLLSLACPREAGESGAAGALAVAAHVDGEAIAVDDVREVLPSALGDRERALDVVIVRRLAASEARRRRIDDSPELAAQLDALRRAAAAREEALLRDALFAARRDEIALAEDELRAHYEKTKVRYSERQLRLRRQAFESAAAARAADAKLGPAGRLDPAASEEVGPAAIAQLPQTVLPEALKLREPGERAVVERDGSAALVELVEILPAAAVPFEVVRDKVEASLRLQRGQQAFSQLLEELRGSAAIEIDEAVLRDDAVWQQSDPAAQRFPARH